MTRFRTRPGVAAGVALVVALAVALGVGAFSYLKLAPAGPTVEGTLGRPVRTGGVVYRLDDLTVAGSLPAEDRGDPAVHGPSGSVLVLVVFTQTVVDHTVALDEHFCDFALRSPTASWEPDSDYTYGIRRPGALVCGSTDDEPLRYDRPRAVAVSFVIPASSTGDLTFRISTDGGRRIIDLRR